MSRVIYTETSGRFQRGESSGENSAEEAGKVGERKSI